jgi:predicted transcriptional regulator YheO
MKAARKRAPTVDLAERKLLLSALHPIVEMLGRFVGPHIEVVLHDLTQPHASVVALANGHISNRSVGSPILMGPMDDKGFIAAYEAIGDRVEQRHSVVPDYVTLAPDGRKLKSGTVVFRDASGEPFAALCLNADMSNFELLHGWLGQLLAPQATPEAADAQRPELDTLMMDIISDAVRRLGKPVSMMNREEKITAVQTMLQRGLFIVKGSVERAAATLEVSRFTIYNYLDVLRQRSGAEN